MAKEFRVQVLNLSGSKISVNPNDTTGFLRHDGTFATAVVPSQTGQFIDSSKTGGFVSISQTGQFVDSSKTGQFISTAQTGNYAPANRTVFTTGAQTVSGLKTFQQIKFDGSNGNSDVLYQTATPVSGGVFKGLGAGDYSGPQTNLEMLSILAGAIGVPDSLRYKPVVNQEYISGGNWITDPAPPLYNNLLGGRANAVDIITANESASGITGKRFVIDIGAGFIRPAVVFLTRGWNQSDWGYQLLLETSTGSGSYSNTRINTTIPTINSAITTFTLGDLGADRYLRFSVTQYETITTGSLKFVSLRGLTTINQGNLLSVYTSSGAEIVANGFISGTTNIGNIFVTPNNTGQFITTAQTGQFTSSGMTGQFITTAQTGRFITTGQTGSLASYTSTVWTTGDQTINGTKTINGTLLLTGATTGNSAFLLMDSISGIRSFDFIPNQSFNIAEYNGGIDVFGCGLYGGYTITDNTLNWKSRQLIGGNWVINRNSVNYPITDSGDTTLLRTTGTQTVLGAKNFRGDFYVFDTPNSVRVFDVSADNYVRIQNNAGAIGIDLNPASLTTGTGFIPVLNWQNKQLTGSWSAGNLFISGNRVITTADTGNFGAGGAGVNAGVSFISVSGVGISGNVSFTGIAGLGVSLSGNTVIISGLPTGNFITSSQTGNFITTNMTGQFAPSGMTGQFITTAQTGIFVSRGETGNAFYPRFGNPANYLTGTSPNGVMSISTSGGTISGAITLTGINGESIIFSGQTIIFSGANTGGLVSISQTGQFITTAMTGQFAPSGMTGQFITTAQTGNFISNGMTGILVPRVETGNAFYPRFGNPSNFLTSAASTGQITQFLPMVTGQVISGNWNFTGISGINVYTSGTYIVWSGQGIGGGGGGTAGVISVIFSGGNSINGNIRITGQHGISISGGSAADNMLFINPIRGNFNLPTGTMMGTMQMDGAPGPFNYIYINWNSGEQFQHIFTGSGYGGAPTKSPKMVFVHTGVVPGKTITCSFINTGVSFYMTNGAPAFSGEPRFYSGVAWEGNLQPSWVGINASFVDESHADVFQFTCIGKTIYGKMTHADVYMPGVVML